MSTTSKPRGSTSGASSCSRVSALCSSNVRTTGAPTGVLVDDAMALVVVPPLSDEQLRERLLAAHDACLRAGLVGVHDAGVDARTLTAMVGLHGEGRWRLRVHVMLDPGETELIARGPWQTGDGVIVVRAVPFE